MAYDPLLAKASAIAGAVVWSFADDAVLAHDSLEGIALFTKAIDAFTHISGFGVNREKSTVLHVLPTSPEDQLALDALGWDRLAFTHKATYLGVLVGHDIDNVDIYQAAFDKFLLRTDSYAPALAHLTLQQRIRTFNIYLLPLLSYLNRFYLLPHKELGDRIRDVIRRRIISFNGAAFKYIHLITPANRFGQACPLKDVWATNVAALACQFDYTSLVWDADRKLAVLPGKLYLNDTGPEWNGLLVEDHIATAALEMVNTFVPYKNGRFDISPFDVSRYKHPKQRLRRVCYNLAMTEYEDDIDDDLTTKLTRMNMTTGNHDHYTPSQNFTLHGLNISNGVPPHVRDFQRLLIFNALATDHRRSSANMHVPARANTPNPYPCFICRIGNDKCDHIFGACAPVLRARDIFGTRIGLRLKSDPKHFGLACKATGPRPDADAIPPTPHHSLARRTNATIIFNHAVWHTRRTFCITSRSNQSHARVATKIANIATMHWNTYTPAHWHTANDSTPPDPAILDSSPYGSAGKRTQAQKKAAHDYGRQLIDGIPQTHYIAYTDGSAIRLGTGTNKATACGAGARLVPPRNRPRETPIDAIAPLGQGTNNIGELFALGMAISMFVMNSDEGASLRILSDSRLATLLIEYNAHAKANKALVKAVRRIYWQAKAHRNIRIHWSPAHVGIEGNEAADVLADEGSRLSSRGLGFSEARLAKAIAEGRFYPIALPPAPQAPRPAAPRDVASPCPTATADTESAARPPSTDRSRQNPLSRKRPLSVQPPPGGALQVSNKRRLPVSGSTPNSLPSRADFFSPRSRRASTAGTDPTSDHQAFSQAGPTPTTRKRPPIAQPLPPPKRIRRQPALPPTPCPLPPASPLHSLPQEPTGADNPRKRLGHEQPNRPSKRARGNLGT